MDDASIKRVQDTWQQVIPIREQAAALFYGRLFELDPSVKPLFTGSMEEQGRKLMNMLGTAAMGLDKLDTIVGAVRELGRRHVAYGVKEEHYDTVGAALLWTLQQGLGDDFTPQVKAAWAEAYDLLATTMKEAAGD